MAARTPAFLQQLNTRNAWVRMTSGVDASDYNGNYANYDGVYNNSLAAFNVLQGGTLLGGNDDNFANLKYGINLREGAREDGAYNWSQGQSETDGIVTFDKYRLGIRPMPGITNVSIQSKGAYGSLQEATVSFNCWDIKQLEKLELLYMRPGYTVLLEFGWDFAKKVNGTVPSYDILNRSNISLNDAFADIYSLIEQSNGTYDALLGYVKNYNWVARDDGGYDCTTTIISLGEVLESLKCNWVPIETTAFSDTGLLNLDLPQFRPLIKNSYELGIIPGLLHEMWGYLRSRKVSSKNFIAKLKDPKNGNTYQLCMSETMGGSEKFNRGGLPKPLGDVLQGIEGWITLGSFCDLLNNYVLLKDQNNNPLTQITTYETDSKGNTNNTSLKCIASPLSLSTNLGVCLIRNDNWAKLGIKQAKEEEAADKKSTPSIPEKTLPSNLQKAFRYRWFRNKPNAGITGNVATKFQDQLTTVPESIEGAKTYIGGKEKFQKDLNTLVNDILNVSSVNIIKDTQAQITVSGGGNTIYKFNSAINSTQKFNVFEYLYNRTSANSNTLTTNTERAEAVYNDLFAVETSTFAVQNIIWGDNVTKKDIIQIIETTLSSFDPYKENPEFASKLKSQLPQAAQNISEEASDTLITAGTLDFLFPENDLTKKALGSISNIYVNINYLYSQAISKNVASNDNQNTNNISIREYLQGILRDIQNSLGNINQFDIQVDERTAIGRIIDLNFTGDPTLELFKLEIHNTNSVVRKYGFQSKIFPEMGSIIAISAQDPSGIGKLGYDNATLVAWNEGIRDRLIPKKTFTNDILLEGTDPTAFILPFLTKINDYFQAIKGQDRDNINFLFGGLDFAYRDFLANLNRFDARNNFKTIIPTSLDITLDGIGGMVIGNLFTINQDIVPKGYRNIPGRNLAYIVTKLGHSISDNDWITELSAYPVIFEVATGTNVASEWTGQRYLNSTEITIGEESAFVFPSNQSTKGFDENNIKTAFNFFLNNGFSAESSAALVGSFLQESELIPQTINIAPFKILAYNASSQTYAAGIAQWVGPRRVELLKYAQSKGINIPNYEAAVKIANNRTKTPQSGKILVAAFANMTLDVQLNFALKEILQNISGWNYNAKIKNRVSYQEFKTSKDINESILWAYEVYGGGNYTERAALGKRGVYAVDILKRYNAGELNSQSSTTTTSQTSTTTANNNPTLTGTKVIAQDIKNATTGRGTNETNLKASIKKIKNVNTFREVNKIVNIQKILNDELGFGDAVIAGEIKDYLNTIGVKMTYSFDTVLGVTTGVTANSIKITYK
jgi:hypothetical protein